MAYYMQSTVWLTFVLSGGTWPQIRLDPWIRRCDKSSLVEHPSSIQDGGLLSSRRVLSGIAEHFEAIILTREQLAHSPSAVARPTSLTKVLLPSSVYGGTDLHARIHPRLKCPSEQFLDEMSFVPPKPPFLRPLGES